MAGESNKEIFLTFDDGPNEPYTSQILDILKKYKVKASFFVCGRNVERFPESLARIVSEGHVIGNHSFSHSFMLSFFGLLRGELEKTSEIIEKSAGVKVRFFRSPWGFFRFRYWLKSYLKNNGYKFVPWDIDSRDWAGLSSNSIVNRVLKRIRPGSIVLLHDGYNAKGGDRSQTVKAVDLLIPKLLDLGYKFTTLNPNG